MSYIMGVNCIREVLLHASDRMIEIYLSGKDFTSDKKKEILALAKEKGIVHQQISLKALESFVHSSSHQGIVAKIRDRKYFTIPEIIKKNQDKGRTCFLMLDSLFDPHNFGAVLRTAECFGIDGVIFSKNRGTDITPVAAKVSSGASEMISLIRVSNLAQSLAALQKEGYEALVADIDESAHNLNTFEFPEKTLLIMGSEGTGVQPLLVKKADQKIYIPMKGRIDSLNVSQAAAVILSRWAQI